MRGPIYRCIAPIVLDLHTRNTVLVSLALILIPFLPSCGLFLDVGFTVAERILYMPRCVGVASFGYCNIDLGCLCVSIHHLPDCCA